MKGKEVDYKPLAVEEEGKVHYVQGQAVAPMYSEMSSEVAGHSLQMWLFIVGWVVHPAWWIGAIMGSCDCCEYRLLTRRERLFHRANLWATFLSLILGIVIFICYFVFAFFAMTKTALAVGQQLDEVTAQFNAGLPGQGGVRGGMP